MGPLKGIKILEIAAIGPVPFCGMLLADMGAEVIRIDRKGSEPSPGDSILGRGKQSITLDLKKPEGRDLCLRLIKSIDALIEGFRPGVMESLGLDPQTCFAVNERLVFGRMTGWGQNGPLAHAAGHDINYIALAGALHTFGAPESVPYPPLNLVGDYGGGALYLSLGLLAAILEAKTSGQGQVVDTAMVDGTASMLAMHHAFLQTGLANEARGKNLLDGGAPFYRTYETKDGEFIALGAIEPKFYQRFLELCGLPDDDAGAQYQYDQWKRQSDKFTDMFRTKTRDEWCQLLEGTDACFAPVLSPLEAPQHAHNVHRGTFIENDGITQPAAVPRFSRTISDPEYSNPAVGEHTTTVLSSLGLSPDDISILEAGGII